MIPLPKPSKLLVCTALLVAGCCRSNGTNEELAQARAALAVARADAAEARADAEAAKAALRKPRPAARVCFAMHTWDGILGTLKVGLLQAEFEKRGFLFKVVRSPHTASKTPHQDRAQVMVRALRHVECDVVLVGVSNEGLFMPLVATARPIRRIVMVNAVVPWPGKAFRGAFDFDQVFATTFARRLARRAPGMAEVCPLKELPKVEYVYVCGEEDDAIRPEWERWAARTYLHVEPVVVQGPGHANIMFRNVKEIVDAATQGL